MAVMVEADAEKCRENSHCLGSSSTQVQRSITEAMARVLGTQVLWSEIFPADPDQIARVRRMLRDALTDRSTFDTIVLLASEAATNSVLHSRSEFFGLVVARTTTGDLRVAVIDEGHGGLPWLRDEAIDDEHGRGIGLVEALAQRWGIIRQPGVGAAVWFDVQ